MDFDYLAKRPYVVDTNNGRVQVYDTDWNFISKCGCTGSGNGQFNLPIDVAVDAENNILYVAYTKNRW